MSEKEKYIFQAADIIKDLSKKGYTKYRIAKETGIAEKTIGNYVNGVNKPSFANAKIIIRYYTGDGEMLKDEKMNNGAKNTEDPDSILLTDDQLYDYGIKIRPHFDSSIYCSQTGFEVMLKNEDAKPRGLPILADYDFSMIAGGNSMINRDHPHLSIAPGDILAFKISSGRFIEWGEVYAIASTDGIIAKKVAPGEPNETIKCISFNEEDGYLPFELHASEVFGMAKLVGIVRINMISNH